MKKVLLFVFFAFVVQNSVFTQPCFPDGITFSYQYEIDIFPNYYPNCTQIEGSVYINGENISNLDGLNQIVLIGEGLFIWQTSITSFSGLSNLATIGGDFYIWENPLVEEFSGFTSLNSFSGQLSIAFNENLISIEGLECITSLTGLYIEGNNTLQSYSGLNNLHSIFGGFTLLNNTSLVDFSGLNNLNSVSNSLRVENAGINSFNGLDSLSILGGNVSIKKDSSLVSFSGLSNITSISSDFAIVSNPLIKNFLGLENLNSIGRDLSIHDNDSLFSLDGLENLLSVLGILSIRHHPRLKNISALSSLFTIGDDLFIFNNNSLSSLEGIGNISAASINHLLIHDNDSLETCNVQSICEYLQAPNGVVSIHSNAQGCNNPSQVADSCGFQLQCLPFGSYHVTSQMEVDDFKADYQGCNELKGSLIIGGENIVNLDSLNEILNVAGGLIIRNNDSLLNLVGLSILDTVGDYLAVYNNNLLESFYGINSLTKIKGSVSVRDNPALISFNGLNNIDTIGGDLEIRNNDLLTDLTPLENLRSIDGELFIWSNDTLESLSGLGNIDDASINSLRITHNSSLSECEVRSICDYIIYQIGSTINYNFEGCNDYFEVKEACETVEVKENEYSNNIKVYPNPTNDEIYIEKSDETVIERIMVFNQLGQVLIDIANYENCIDLSKLNKGVFYIVLKCENHTIRKKIIKI